MLTKEESTIGQFVTDQQGRMGHIVELLGQTDGVITRVRVAWILGKGKTRRTWMRPSVLTAGKR